MSIDMYLEAARTQAESLGRAVEQCLGQNLKLISVLSAFHNEDELKGKAYDSAKNHVVGTVIPIVQGVILYQEAIALACQNFVSNYTAEVDGKSWRQSELEEKIRFAEQQLAELERKSQLYANNKGMSIVDFSASIAVAESARQVFQEILDNLLAFNESSPTIFAEAETYLVAASTGLSQAAQSWDASTQTYLPPRRDADLSWKGTINTGWTKRQEMIEEVKRQNSKKTEFDRIAEMDYDDLLHNYSEIISAKESGDLNSPYYKPNKTEYRIKLEKAVVKRYEEVKDLPRETNVSKYTLQKVDPFFKAKIDRMNQKELEEYYPGLKFSPIAPILDHNYYSSETDKANDIYLAARYQELDSQNPISKHDPNFEQKRFEYIAETGLDPVTNKEADKELLNYATNYTKYAPSIKAGYDFLMVGTAAWSTRAYNKDLQSQRANAKVNEYYQIKDAVRNSSVGSQPVVGPQLPSKNWTPELPLMNNIQSKYVDLYSYEYNSYTNPGPLSEFSTTPNRNFYGGRYNKTVLSEDTIFYRAGNADNPLGQWFTREAPQSRAQVRIDTAVKDIWTNPDGSYSGQSAIDKVYKIKIPKGTTIYDGPVGSQGGIYQGGLNKEQIFIDSPWNLDGVEVIDSWPIIH
ncbi:cytosolic protein [Streptococcus sanguinis SK49]|uniref:Cytosolic protein n=1 Tax=Streptococcus sanguinis SK49 TaxID=888808 RepID=F3UVG3_STRSA|nr:hypothetical protein [Streptococcus sanguinis]EGJ41131.1 cytosolic protein [Streptococcus sanguinis SK49]